MALPVAERVRAALPRVQIAFTFFSPSAAELARRLDVDFADYLPFDSAPSVRAALDALAPTALVFTKADVWPVLVAEAARRRVQLGLISASMPDRSRRTNGFASALTRDAYHSLDSIGAASDEDAGALSRAGARPDQIRVTGDTRYDQAWTRAHIQPRNGDVISALKSNRPTIVAGSTWRSDEMELLPAYDRLRMDHPSTRLIIAPHEVDHRTIAQLEFRARRNGVNVVRLDPTDADDPDIIIVDRVGVLADLYALATAAYVGGGFHHAGLHSLVEPAVFRVPTVIGPHHTTSRDARMMLVAGGVACASDSDGIYNTMHRILTDTDQRTAMSDALGFVVTGELGAADRSFDMVRQLLGTV